MLVRVRSELLGFDSNRRCQQVPLKIPVTLQA